MKVAEAKKKQQAMLELAKMEVMHEEKLWKEEEAYPCVRQGWYLIMFVTSSYLPSIVGTKGKTSPKSSYTSRKWGECDSDMSCYCHAQVKVVVMQSSDNKYKVGTKSTVKAQPIFKTTKTKPAPANSESESEMFSKHRKTKQAVVSESESELWWL